MEKKMKKYKKIILICLVIFSALLIGCSPLETTENTEDKESSLPVRNDMSKNNTLNLSTISFSTLDPLTNNEESFYYVTKLLYDGLFDYDEDYNLRNKLAESFTVDSANKTITVRLKDNLIWHNSSNLTATDVKYTFDYIKKYPESPYYKILENFASAKVENASTIIFYLNKAEYLSVNNLIFPIINPESVTNNGFEKIIGNGMYKWVSYDKGKSISLKSNEDYYLEKPKIKDITVKIVPDVYSLHDSVVSLESDIVKSDIASLSKFNFKRFNKAEFVGRNIEMLAFNTLIPPFDKLSARKAFIAATDRNEVLKDAFLNEAVMSVIPVNPSIKYNQIKDKTYRYSVEKSGIITDEYKENITLIVGSSDLFRVKAAYLIKEQFLKLNISVEVLILDEEAFEKAISEKKYNLALINYKTPVNNNVADFFTKDNNITGFDISKFNELMDDACSSSSSEEFETKYNTSIKYISTQAPFLGFVYPKEYVIVNSRIKGELLPNEYNIYNNIHKLYILD